jgi:hypothetical protein
MKRLSRVNPERHQHDDRLPALRTWDVPAGNAGVADVVEIRPEAIEMTNRNRKPRPTGAGSIRTLSHAVTRALARIPRSGSLHVNVHGESELLAKKLRPMLHDFRLGSVVHALFTLAAEYASQLLRVEREGCDCTHDVPNGLFRCDSDRHHAVNDIVIIEKEHRHAKNR